MAIAKPSPRSITPAFSAPGATSKRLDEDGRVRSRALVCLYPQCSDHKAPNSPNSSGAGSRPSLSIIISYSVRLKAISSSVCWLTVIWAFCSLVARNFNSAKHSHFKEVIVFSIRDLKIIFPSSPPISFSLAFSG